MKLFFIALMFFNYCCTTIEDPNGNAQYFNYLNTVEINSFSDFYRFNKQDELISSIVKKEICSLEELDSMFCLNLSLGHFYFNVIYHEVKNLIYFKESDFGLFLLKRCLQNRKNNDAFYLFDEFLLKEYGYGFNINLTFKDNLKINDNDKKRLYIIFHSIFRYKSTDKLQEISYNDNLIVKILPIRENKSDWFELNNVYYDIINGNISVILSEFMRKHMTFVGGIFEFIYNIQLRERIILSEIFNNLKIKNFLKSCSSDQIKLLKRLIDGEVYQDYSKFKSNLKRNGVH